MPPDPNFTLFFVVADADKLAADALMINLIGGSGSNFSKPLSGDGGVSVTHWGCQINRPQSVYNGFVAEIAPGGEVPSGVAYRTTLRPALFQETTFEGTQASVGQPWKASDCLAELGLETV